MGKKKSIMILKGSLKTHWIRYVTTLNLNVNPADAYGNAQAKGVLRMLNTIESKYLQPGFAFNFNLITNKGFYNSSIMDLKFVNGYQRDYNLALCHIDTIKNEINHINDIVEFERASNGQDDEMEDDA